MISSMMRSIQTLGGSIQTAEIDDDSVTSAKLADSIAVTTSLTATGTFIGTRPSATILGIAGSIPITALCANIDAGGSARDGVKFGGAGTAGQMLIVNNTGGEALRFDNTDSTSLLRGTEATHDTMEANFMGLFISDGTYWNLVAGGVDTQPDVGLIAS